MPDTLSPTKLAAGFDHTSEAQMEQPYELYRQLRDQCPVGHSEAHGGFWFAMRFDLDPPQHTDLKAALVPLLHISRAEAIAAEVEAEAERILARAAPSGAIDFVALADYIPATFALRVIGIDEADRPQLIEWVDFLTHGRTHPEKAAEVGAEFDSFVLDFVARRRTEARRDDIISSLFDTDVPGMGGKLTDDQIRRTVVLLIFGGLHTTRSAILESLLYIARHPEVRQALLENLDNEAFWGPAIDEFLRFSTPTQILKRQVTCPIEVHGQALKAGDDLMVCYGSANHDERKFPEPERVILDRSPNPHLTFGTGPHRCIGQYFARVFLRGAIKGALRRMPDFRVADDFEPRYQVGEARAMLNLPATFTASSS
jgi:cytochrome P450